MPKISVIIPCYNVGLFIDRCLSSVMAQSIGIEGLEIICVDDASTDNTWDCLQAWERRYPNIVILIRQEINHRQGAARNLGLQYATAPWISFVDADDWLEPDYLERLYAPTTQFPCDVVSCGWELDKSDSLVYFDQGPERQGEDQYIVVDSRNMTEELFERKLLGSGPVAKLLRRELLVDSHILFPECLAYEDHYWIPLLYIYTKRAYIVGKNLYHYYLNPASTIHLKNEDYHMDWITVQLMKWADYKKRGLWEEFREMLEGDALYDAAGFIKTLILRYDKPPYSFFLLESELIRQQVPDYRSNLYASTLAEISSLFLEALYSSVNQEYFNRIADEVRKYYGQA